MSKEEQIAPHLKLPDPPDSSCAAISVTGVPPLPPPPGFKPLAAPSSAQIHPVVASDPVIQHVAEANSLIGCSTAAISSEIRGSSSVSLPMAMDDISESPARNTRAASKRRSSVKSIEVEGGSKLLRDASSSRFRRAPRSFYVSPKIEQLVEISTTGGPVRVSPKTKSILDRTRKKFMPKKTPGTPYFSPSSDLRVFEVGFSPGAKSIAESGMIAAKGVNADSPLSKELLIEIFNESVIEFHATKKSQSILGPAPDSMIVDGTSANVNKEPPVVFTAVKNVDAINSVKQSYAGAVKGDSQEGTIVLSYVPPLILPSGDVIVKLNKEQLASTIEACSLTLYGYLVGGKISFGMLNFQLMKMWKKYGIIDISSNNSGFFFFRFENEDGMNKVLDFGIWLVKNVPLCLKRWEPNLKLCKIEPKMVPVWASIADLPLEFWNGDVLSSIISSIGVPIMLDNMTTDRCLSCSGRAGFARFLVNAKADKDLPSVVNVKYPDFGKHPGKMLQLTVDYEWLPPRCSYCCVFGHVLEDCSLCPKKVADPIIPEVNNEDGVVNMEADDEGFQVVGKRNKPIKDKVVNGNAKASAGANGQADVHVQSTNQSNQRVSVFDRLQGYKGAKPADKNQSSSVSGQQSQMGTAAKQVEKAASKQAFNNSKSAPGKASGKAVVGASPGSKTGDFGGLKRGFWQEKKGKRSSSNAPKQVGSSAVSGSLNSSTNVAGLKGASGSNSGDPKGIVGNNGGGSVGKTAKQVQYEATKIANRFSALRSGADLKDVNMVDSLDVLFLDGDDFSLAGGATIIVWASELFVWLFGPGYRLVWSFFSDLGQFWFLIIDWAYSRVGLVIIELAGFSFGWFDCYWASVDYWINVMVWAAGSWTAIDAVGVTLEPRHWIYVFMSLVLDSFYVFGFLPFVAVYFARDCWFSLFGLEVYFVLGRVDLSGIDFVLGRVNF
ncbi:hypothetical protein SSX86_027509 [Deinandra increscens subsp. villosa]|uniref:DUF4283 domain-containing protein n=1 Tax=Deinandra increscens subsp. villosa TaxID=3103831 RepID=A0AAP0GM68_9ASTR